MKIENDDSGLTSALAGWNLKDVAILVGLAIVGIVYFGQYYDCGFNIADEGSVVLIAARLLEGERPFLDIIIGYGLLWLYPLVLLFKITGTSFVAARIYFISLALTTSLLAFLTVRRHTHRRVLAVAVALLTLMMPGTLHKTYIPLIVVANMLCLPSLRRHRMVLGGKQVFGAALVVAVSYHIRPDLGLCAALTLIAILVAHAISREMGWVSRIYQACRLLTLFCATALVPTLPLIIFARSQGFLEPFLRELYQPIKFLSEILDTVFATLLSFVREIFFVQVAWATPTQSVDSEVPAEAGKTLARIPWSAVWEEGAQRDLAILTYLPLFSLSLLALFALFLMLRRMRGSRPLVADDTVGMLGLLGLAYSAFPQFFMFRPDFAHLAQFMPGFMVLVTIGIERWFLPPPGGVQGGSGTAAREGKVSLLGRTLAVCFLVFHVGFYIWSGVLRTSSGSSALARGKTERFLGANGVDVAVSPKRKRLFAAASQIIHENTKPGDVMLCLPYCPGFNVMTQRRTFLRRLYVDDAMLKLEPRWQERTIARIQDERVPLIIIQDWAVNGTQISRFKNWATNVMDYITANYELVDRVGTFRFYVRQSHGMSHDSAVERDLEPMS